MNAAMSQLLDQCKAAGGDCHQLQVCIGDACVLIGTGVRSDAKDVAS